MKVLGILLVILGFMTMIFGGLGLAIYAIYDLVINWEELTRVEIFWNIVWFIIRDVLAIIAGLVMLFFGMAMRDS